MREIKFRAWNKEKNIMVYGREDDSQTYWDGVCITDVEMVNARFSPCHVNIEGYIWMQYTGLKDKNGVEIYEGDVVWDGNDIAGIDSYSLVEYDEEFSGFIVYTPGTITPLYEALEYGRAKDGETGKNVSGVYVAGNIYENPELLEDN